MLIDSRIFLKVLITQMFIKIIITPFTSQY